MYLFKTSSALATNLFAFCKKSDVIVDKFITWKNNNIPYAKLVRYCGFKFSIQNMATNYEKPYYQASSQRKWVSRITFIIVMITTVVVSFIVYQNIDNIKEMFTSTDEITTEETTLHIGDKVELSGFITNDGDVRTYSHTLATKDYAKLGLTSRTIDLNEYEWEVVIQWEVERLQGSVYVIAVNKITWEKKALVETGDDQSTEYNSGKYFPQAGIYFPANFFNQFKLLNQGEWGVIKVKNIWSTQELSIKYFACDKSDASKNCDQLEKQFANAGEKSFQTVNGVVMYKLYEVESRFARSNYRGYFINNVNESEVASLVQYMKVVNNELVDETIKPNISKLCQTGWQVMESLQDYTITKQWNEIIVNLNWESEEGSIACKVWLNPNLVQWATVIDTTFKAAEVNTWDIVDTNTWATADLETGESKEIDGNDGTLNLDDLNYNEQEENTEDDLAAYDGEQFPINLEKTLIFKSHRWHTIIFPSSNISYAGVNISSDLGVEGVNCFSQMNVVKYGTSEEDRDAHPSVKIYECSIKGNFVWTNKYRQIDVWDDRHFIIETVDPARANFADHIEIK